MLLASRGGRANVGEVAEFFKISRDHLAKVARRLSQEGFIRTLRGVGGGLELAKPAADIRIGEVIRAFEGATHLLDCVITPGLCVIQPGCRLRGVFAEAEKRQMDYLNSVRLSDVVTPETPLIELTFEPRSDSRSRSRLAKSSTSP
jgi:Rrf2 family nitric oxide-sensitive transcriptional repressor